MKTMAYIGCALSAALVGGCANAPDTGKVADEVKGAMDKTVTALNAKDAEAAVTVDAPGYIGMFHGTNNVVGPTQDLALTKMLVDDPAAKVEVVSPEVNVAASGDMAVWKAGYNYTFTDPKTKAPKTEQGNWLVVFRRQLDGSMKASMGVVSDTAPPAGKPA